MPMPVDGTIDDNGIDRGPPVKVGGRYNSTAQTYADGDRADLQTDVAGRLLTADVNTEVTAFASAARTATANSSDLTNRYAKGAVLTLDVTAASGTTPTLDVTIQAKDGLSAAYVAIPSAAFAQKTGVSTDTLVVYPGIAETANRSVSDVLPLTWRAVATIGGTTPSFTFSLGVSYIR